MKKIFPLFLALVIFAVALILNQPEQQIPVVVAAADLPEGRILMASDLATKSMPKSLAPADALADVDAVAGQRLRVSRSAGDPILPAHLGGAALELQPNERAVALQVSAAQGLAGLLTPGDYVGLTVIVNQSQQTFAKYLVGGLRVLWVDPAFQRFEPVPAETDTASPFAAPAMDAGGGVAEKGLIVLAIPVDARAVIYDFSLFGLPNDSRPLYLVDLLPALSAQGAQFGLVLEPEKAQEAITSGIALQNLAIIPPTPTPTLAPYMP